MTTQTISLADLRRPPTPKRESADANTNASTVGDTDRDTDGITNTPVSAGDRASSTPPGVDPKSKDDFRLHRRFDRMGRLLGDQGMARLFSSHVMIVGIGGVGSWAAESLARSGVGQISLVDFDLICVTNTNRQLHALKGTTGKAKVAVMAERLRLVQPRCTVQAVRKFYNQKTSAELLADPPDLVIDAIDNLAAKTHLIATCRARGLPLVVSGGASGRLDPTQIRESDLAKVKGDPFLAATRKILRQRHEFPRSDALWDLPTIHSTEEPALPQSLAYDDGAFQCVCPQGQNSPHSCEHRSVIYGTASFVTGAFGLACAAAAVRILLNTSERRAP
ncbi:MAG TPA: tRNA threonylcarbamoyladenosine dehydratase [Nannocystis exedens]|nr:tRNA threonylcarbamoyladenosine dehydratase [Nannocystis exedens]